MKGKGVSVPKSTTATITKVSHKLNKYKVKADIDGQKAEEWLQVVNISSLTRDEEKNREKNVR